MITFKKTISIFSLFALLVTTVPLQWVSAQTIDDQLVDKINEEEMSNRDQLQESLEFEQFNSCMDMETTLQDFVKKWKEHQPLPRRGGGVFFEGEMDFALSEEMAVPTVGGSNEVMLKSVRDDSVDTIQSSSDEYSSTNLQKSRVDEPEIIKTNGEYYFYYNEQEHKVYVMSSPFDISDGTITLDDAKIETIVTIPQKITNPQMFVLDEKLVIMWTRYTQLTRQHTLNRNTRTSVAIYDFSDVSSPLLEKYIDLDGAYSDARMIDEKLYIISQIWVQRHYLYDHPALLEDGKLSPKAVEFSQEKVSVIKPDCDQISYILPSDDTMKQLRFYPEFIIVSVIDVEDTKKETELTALLANRWQIHMSQNSLYISQNLRFSNYFACPLGSRCMMPQFRDGEYSLIHKFDVDGFSVDYQDSNIVPGTLLNQYSMDEDEDGNFRILTRAWWWNEWTSFYALDDKLELKGKIQNIMPGEEFKSSRYIWDKLYLVTYERTDPLFVIDIQDIENPEIVWELHIPGFSSYLHPMWEIKNGVQYLIGLGYGANEFGRSEWLQISLYKIDYNGNETIDSRCSRLDKPEYENEYETCLAWVDEENIYVAQIDSKTFGWRGSNSIAMENPRTFVMDANNVVSLPMVLQEEVVSGEDCNVQKDDNGTIISQKCRPVSHNETTFAWLKQIAFDVEDGISEKFSANYLALFKKVYPSKWEYYYYIPSYTMRVGFAGDALYMINNDFAHFVLPEHDAGKYLYFDEKLD